MASEVEMKTMYQPQAILNLLFFFLSLNFSELRTCLHNCHVAFVGNPQTRGLSCHLVQALSLNAVKDEGKAVKCFCLVRS